MKTQYSIGELAKEFGVSTRALRFYESKSLLNPIRNGSQRIYLQQHKTRLKLILRGKRLGFSLAETKHLFELYDADPSSQTQLQSMLLILKQKKQQLHQQLEDIQSMLCELENAEQTCLDYLQLNAKT